MAIHQLHPEPRDPAPHDLQLDWAALLAPVSSMAPSGPNLEYGAEFAELERLSRGTPDRQMGASLMPGQAPDLPAVLHRGVALLQQTKDVRVFTQLLAASIPTLGLLCFVRGLSALHELLAQLWDSVHPELDPDDEAHATARANATMACASPELVRALRAAPLIVSRSRGSLCLDEALSALRDGGAADGSTEAGRVLRALREHPTADLQPLFSALHTGLRQCTAISSLFAARSGAVPDLSPLRSFFEDALLVLGQHRAEPRAALPSPSAGSLPAGGDAHAPAAFAVPAVEASAARNRILCRDDVLEALEAICAYYRAQEPTSPVPLLLRRCQRLVGLDFLGTVRELAPEALAKLALISGDNAEPSRS